MRRLAPKAIFILLGVGLLAARLAPAQTISVTLPTLYTTDKQVSLPVTIGDVTGQDVKAFLFTISYDPDVLEVTGTDTQGLLADGFSIVENMTVPGQITLAAAHSAALAGEGVLMYLHARFKSKGTTDLDFGSFTFNEGQPRAGTTDGVLSNVSPVNNEDEAGLPAAFELQGNYPNPFNPTTTIRFDLPEAAEVRIDVVDMLGRRVMEVPSQALPAGAGHRVQLDASELASGVYLYRVVAAGVSDTFVKTATMTLIK